MDMRPASKAVKAAPLVPLPEGAIIHNLELARDLRQASPEPACRYQAAPIALGDWIERRALPIAHGIDRLTAALPPRLRTQIAGCSACSKRRRFLNMVVPNCKAWNGGWKGSFLRFAIAWKAIYRPIPASAPQRL